MEIPDGTFLCGSSMFSRCALQFPPTIKKQFCQQQTRVMCALPSLFARQLFIEAFFSFCPQQIALMTVTLFPIRLFIAAFMMLLAWPFAFLASVGRSETTVEPQCLWRRWVSSYSHNSHYIYQYVVVLLITSSAVAIHHSTLVCRFHSCFWFAV